MEPIPVSSPPLSPEKMQRRRLRNLGNFCGALILAMYAAQFIVGLVVGVCAGLGVLDAAAPHYGIGLVGEELLNIIIYLFFLAIPAVAVVGITRTRVNPFPTRRMSPVLFVCLVLGGMALAILFNLITSYLLVFLESSGVQAAAPDSSVDPSLAGLLLSLLSTALLPGLLEEMVFRGFMLGALRPLGNANAMWISALIFGIFHGNVQQFVFAFLLGLVLAYLTVQTESIWPAVVLHFSNNAMSVVLTYAQNFVSEEQAPVLTLTTFALVCVAGSIALSVLLATDRGGTGRADVLRPVFNGRGLFTPAKRVGWLFTSPLLIIASVIMIIQLMGTVSLA